jgi:hypothetical protein
MQFSSINSTEAILTTWPRTVALRFLLRKPRKHSKGRYAFKIVQDSIRFVWIRYRPLQRADIASVQVRNCERVEFSLILEWVMVGVWQLPLFDRLFSSLYWWVVRSYNLDLLCIMQWCSGETNFYLQLFYLHWMNCDSSIYYLVFSIHLLNDQILDFKKKWKKGKDSIYEIWLSG